jgi:flavorubredoxin
VIRTFAASADIDVVASSASIPGLGSIAINAFVLHGAEPVLVDTGCVRERTEFMAALRTVIDPAELRWIWLTHTDADHIGALDVLLAENPRLRVMTTYLGVGVMGLSAPFPMDRVCLVNPGQTIEVGDRSLHAVRPPVFDNPVTTGFYESRSGALFSSDCFGALLPSVPDRADAIPDAELREGQMLWATIDSPWLHKVDVAAFAADLHAVRAMEPRMILSSHLPPAHGAMVGRLLGALEAAPQASPFVGPDQAMLEHMLSELTTGVAS